ncbi:MAG: tetratricopeptide repeat protein [Myxococcales bacterium]
MAPGLWGRKAAAALALALVLPACGALDTVKARQLAREGNALYRASDYHGAIAKYHEAIKLDPNTPNVYLNLGYALFSIFDPSAVKADDRKAAAEAIEAFDKHLVQQPKDDKAKAFRIKILLRAAPGDPAMADKAYAHFAELLAANPNDVEVKQYLVTLFIDCRRYAQAVKHFEPALEKNPEDVDTMKVLAIIADKSGETQAAVDWYRRRAEATKDPAKQASLYYELGTYAWNTLHYSPDKAKGVAALILADQGIEAERRAIALKSDYAEAMAYANLLFLKRAAAETTEQGKYFDEQTAYEYRTEAGKILGARKEKEAAAAATAAGAPGGTTPAANSPDAGSPAGKEAGSTASK